MELIMLCMSTNYSTYHHMHDQSAVHSSSESTLYKWSCMRLMPTMVPLLQIACQQQNLASTTCMGSYIQGTHNLTLLDHTTCSLDPIPFWPFQKSLQSRLDHNSFIPRPCGKKKISWEWGYSDALHELIVVRFRKTPMHCLTSLVPRPPPFLFFGLCPV